MEKTQLEQTGMALLTLFIIGIIIFLAVLVGSSFIDSVDLLSDDSTATLLPFSTSGLTFADCSASPTGVITALALVNGSGAITLTSGNYTTAGCVVTATATSEFNNTLVNATYTYSHKDSTLIDTINGTTSGIADFVDWIPIIVIMFAVIIVIGLIALFRRSANGMI